MIRKLSILLFVFFLLSFQAYAIRFDIRIYADYRIISFDFTPLSGEYGIYHKNVKIYALPNNSTVNFAIEGDKIRVKDIGLFDTLNITGTELLNKFKIKPLNFKERIYDDDIKLTVSGNSLRIINHVELEHYVTGVVEAESGGSVNILEYFKVQAIICRTYALNNYRKHLEEEGYNLCDKVHCQVYRGKCKSSFILNAVTETTGDVIVDADTNLISAAFHSNCGGQTVNSEDVWTYPLPYLRSIRDSFCSGKPNARWEKTIPSKDWTTYLQKHKFYPVKQKIAFNDSFPTENNASLQTVNSFAFSQNTRKVYLYDSLPLKYIRTDFNLRSTFFAVQHKNDTICLTGKGYGHGVGLCQEGAMRMAELGYKFKDIINFYYSGVSVINFEQLTKIKTIDFR